MKIKQLRFIRLGILFIFALFSVSLNAADPAAKKAKPNVLFIAIDDLYDWVGVLDGHRRFKRRTSTNWQRSV